MLKNNDTLIRKMFQIVLGKYFSKEFFLEREQEYNSLVIFSKYCSSYVSVIFL